MKAFKLPPLGRFASRNKNMDPYLKFFSWVGKKLDPEWKPKCGIQIDPSRIGLSKEDEEALFILECEWGERLGISGREMAWHNLMYGPSVVKKPSGHVYVTGRVFKKKKKLDENHS